jgi:hypothetical protein
MGSFVRYMVKYLFLVLAALGVVDLVRQDIFMIMVCFRSSGLLQSCGARRSMLCNYYALSAPEFAGVFPTANAA